ncbi:MAG: hypothetical protein AAGH78_17425 [Cyanobacteria bacterium P01_H01_bin.58]
MNVPLNSDATLYSGSESATSGTSTGYSPSVPISVYRELAMELKGIQQTADALKRQNQQLMRQNQLLRGEIQRFVQSAQQLGHFAGVMPQEAPVAKPEPPLQAAQPDPVPSRSVSPQPDILSAAMTASVEAAIVPQEPERQRDRPQPSLVEAPKQRLFTEQPERLRPFGSGGIRPDLNTLWLATTILLVIVTAFGAGFLIMRPLLKR